MAVASVSILKTKACMSANPLLGKYILSQFHSSPKFFVRRVSKPFRNTVDEKVHSNLNKANVGFSELSVHCNAVREYTDDIFGIESDEGAMCFDQANPRPEKFRHLFPKSKKKDMLHKTSFGRVRIDHENAPKSFGQQVCENTKSLKPERNQSNSRIPAMKKIYLSEDFESSNNSSRRFNNDTVVDKDHLTNHKFLSDDIWKQLGHTDTINFKSNLEVVNNVTKRQIFAETGLSEVDEQYFGNDKIDLNTMKQNVGLSSDTKKVDVSEIDKQYFGDDVNTVKDKYIKNNDLHFEKENDIPTDLTNIIKQNQGFSSDASKIDAISEIDRQYFKDDINYIDNKFTRNRTFSQSNELDFEIENEISSIKDVSCEQDRKLSNVTKIVSNAKSSLFNDLERSNNDHTKKNLGKEKHSISTAHEYVKQLRKEKANKNQANQKSTSVDGIKLDSKGFRILTNQVPDLSLLTNEELITELRTRILYQDDDIMILDKPYNLVMHEAKSNKEPSLSNVLDDLAKLIFKDSSESPKLFTVHRLDKTTTGCLLLARNEMAAQHLKSLFSQRKITKNYWILTRGVPEQKEGIIDMPITEGKIDGKARMVLCPELPEEIAYKVHCKHGKQAITQYRVIATSGNASLIEAKSQTGLKHQIRVHFGLGLGCPIIGDHKYSYIDKLVPQKLPSDLLQRLGVRQSKVRYIPMHIHARSVMIPNYLDGRDLFISAPLPNHMRRNLQSLQFRKK